MTSVVPRGMAVSDCYRRLRGDIVTGALMPNERLVEADCARRLGVSRAVVRTVLGRLEQNGLVACEPNRGARVRTLGEDEAVEITQVRAVLEVLAAKQAARNATERDVAEIRGILGEMTRRLVVGDLLGYSEINARSSGSAGTRERAEKRTNGYRMSDEHPRPSERSRALVEGAYDLHIHVAPDLMDRRIDDVGLARRYREAGLAGFVLKSHYVPTAERAAVVRGVVPDVQALGAVTLNGSVGGMNPVLVEVAAREGARVVWMPTVDAANQRRSRAQDPPGAKPPMWARVQDELREQGIAVPPIEVTGPDGRALPEVLDVLRAIARHDMVLATGHLGRDEIFAVVDAAVAEGVRRVIVTHPEFTSQRLSAADQQALADRGAWLERCFTTPYTGKVAWADMIANVRAAGPQNSVLSSDLGQPFNPPVEEGLPLMADFLLDAGFTEEEVHTMAVTNTVALGSPGVPA